MANAQTPTKKRLMLVVHGLGEQGPGETLDDLAGGLWGDLNNIHVESDIRQLQEDKPEDPQKLPTFPCHVRRYADASTPHNPHTTFAEVYWADLSEADRGAIRIFYGLIKTILGLGHIVRASAKQYFGAGSLAAKISNLVPYIMHGPVAGVNVALAVGVLVLFAANKVFGDLSDDLWAAHIALLIAGIMLVGYGASQRNHAVYYYRIFVVWTGVFGALLALLAGIQFFGLNISSFTSVVAQALLGEVERAKDLFDPKEPLKDLVASYGVILLFCLKLAWMAASGAIFLCLLATWKTGKRVKRGEQTAGTKPEECEEVAIPPLPLILICAMAWLWMLVVSIIWVSVERTKFFGDLIHTGLLNNGVQLLVVALAGIALIFGCALLTLRRRAKWHADFKGKEPSEMNAIFKDHPVPRMLLSAPLARGLTLAGLLLAVGAGFSLVQLVGWLIGSEIKSDIEHWNNEYLPKAIAVAGFIGVLAYSQREGISQALGVGKDLITYFKVEPSYFGPDGKTADAPKMQAFSRPENFEFDDFRQRKRIHARMQRVLSALWDDGYKELIVVSHSQGTIIATEFAKELHDSASELIPKEVRERLAPIMQGATLVTMGSPFTHVYNYYLPDEFGEPLSIDDTMIAKWINIFRIDDFIGTYIGRSDLEGEWPVNQAVPASGHTGYWTDAHVIKHLRPLVD